MASRPAVLPETYSGEGSFTEWIDHFDSVAEVNAWDDAAKSLWIRVRLVGRAQTAFKWLDADTRANFAAAKSALKARFEPASKSALYEAEFQTRRKQPSEDWASFGEDVKALADKAFPELEEAARERLAVGQFLSQLDPQIGFSVRQSKPKTISVAIAATLEVESYRTAPSGPAQPEASFVAAVHAKQDATMDLLTHIEKLEVEVSAQTSRHGPDRRRETTRRDSYGSASQRSPVVCRRCGKEGHYSRGCASPRTSGASGNE